MKNLMLTLAALALVLGSPVHAGEKKSCKDCCGDKCAECCKGECSKCCAK